MSGINDGFVGKGPKLPADAVEQGLVVAAREVGAADASPEKDVAADQEAFRGAIEPETAGGVPREEKDIEAVVSEVEGVARGKEDQLPTVIFEGHIPGLTPFGSRCQQRLLLFVEMEG